MASEVRQKIIDSLDYLSFRSYSSPMGVKPLTQNEWDMSLTRVEQMDRCHDLLTLLPDYLSEKVNNACLLLIREYMALDPDATPFQDIQADKDCAKYMEEMEASGSSIHSLLGRLVYWFAKLGNPSLDSLRASDRRKELRFAILVCVRIRELAETEFIL